MFDDWRIGFVRKPQSHVLTSAGPRLDEAVWLAPPAKDFRYLADPFGVVREGLLTIFCEAYDYRTRRGEIQFHQFDGAEPVRQGRALAAYFHLSYPSLIDRDGVLYLLPEAHRSGTLTLYRCDAFPDRWTPVARLLDLPAIDATVVRFQGGWWMFYALPGPGDRAMRELHVAFSPDLEGPWRPHPGNPVRSGFLDSRPGGAPIIHEGRLYLPMQVCAPAYGSAVQMLRVDDLSATAFAATPVLRLEPAGLKPGFEDGLHTLSGGADVTLFDVKGLRTSRRERLIRLQYKARRLLNLNGPVS